MASKRWFRAVALLIGTGAAVAVVEIGARVLGLSPLPVQYGDNVPDDAIAYRRRPGSTLRGRSESGEFEFRYDHNSLGFRDSEHALAKPPGTRRIVALGDSFTYGAGADFDDTYLARVERLLAERPGAHRPVEIVKLGLPRHFPLLERLTLERYGLAFAPDVVMIALLPNDVLDTQREPDTVCVAPSGFLVSCAALGWSGPALWLYDRSAAARIALRAWGRLTAAGLSSRNDDGMFADGGPYESAWRSLEAELERIGEDARAHGAALVVVAIPQAPPWRPMHSYPETRLSRWSANHGAVFIPTLEALRAAAPRAPLYWKRDGHCMAAGYAVIADEIAAGLAGHGLAP